MVQREEEEREICIRKRNHNRPPNQAAPQKRQHGMQAQCNPKNKPHDHERGMKRPSMEADYLENLLPFPS